MGAIFKLQHANIMAYVTSRSYSAPRVLKQDLSDFLDAIRYDAKRYLIPEPGFEPWLDEIAELAGRAGERLLKTKDIAERETLSGAIVGRLQ